MLIHDLSSPFLEIFLREGQVQVEALQIGLIEDFGQLSYF